MYELQLQLQLQLQLIACRRINHFSELLLLWWVYSTTLVWFQALIKIVDEILE